MPNDLSTATDKIQLSLPETYFQSKSWRPFHFQLTSWQAYREGKSGLIQVPTGMGKTYAALMGPLEKMSKMQSKGLQLIYITPLKALSSDLLKNLQETINAMNLSLTCALRTGDSSASERARLKSKPTDILITTPESFHLMMSYKGAEKNFQNIHSVIVDEWHELVSSKRGALLSLSLAWLRQIRADLQTWGMSATLSNSRRALQELVGYAHESKSLIVTEQSQKQIRLDVLLPETISSLPYRGHIGEQMVRPLLKILDKKESTLIFTNTRLQADIWYERLINLLPEFSDKIALHHGSLDSVERFFVEGAMKAGFLKWCVCTASLDLGIDFPVVKRVVQIGSPKSVARLIQRAGRSGHQPGAVSNVLLIPTNALEIFEAQALQKALDEKTVERARPYELSLDILTQFVSTLAAGDGADPKMIKTIVRDIPNLHNLRNDDLNEILEFLQGGGRALSVYPEYQKLRWDKDQERYFMASLSFSSRHRLQIGTITQDAMVTLKYRTRKTLGRVDERFITQLQPGDAFIYTGRVLELVRLRDMEGIVKPSKKKAVKFVRWQGTALPYSEILAKKLQQVMAEVPNSHFGEQMQPLIERQNHLSVWPKEKELLIESFQSRHESHLFVYPFLGEQVHMGLANFWALLMTREKKLSLHISTNDYGFHLSAERGINLQDFIKDDMFNISRLQAMLPETINLDELARRKFRSVAQISGLVFNGYPGAKKKTWQMQTSSSLLYDVFSKYDPENYLFQQARREIFDRDIDIELLARSLMRMRAQARFFVKLKKPSPLAFPLLVAQISQRLSSEKLADRISRMVETWQKI